MNNTVITMDTINAAQALDLDATTAIIEAMESRVSTLARKAANRRGYGFAEAFEEMAQLGRTTTWDALPRFKGETVDEFYAFMYATIDAALLDAVRAERYAGADSDAVKVFAQMMELADGDGFLAAKLAQTVPDAGRRISADRADAARLAWYGSHSLDAPVNANGQSATGGHHGGAHDSVSLVSNLGVTDETPDVIRPKVGAGAALEALAVLQRYSSAYEVLSALPADADAVDAIEDTLTVPRDPAVRRYVLDAVAILRSYVSTTTEGDLHDDLRDVSDERGEDRAAKIGTVNAVLDAMGETQRVVLRHSFGIKGATFYGWGKTGNDEGLASEVYLLADAGAVKKVRDAREKGLKSFAKRWVKIMAHGDEQRTEELTKAAAKNLTRNK